MIETSSISLAQLSSSAIDYSLQLLNDTGQADPQLRHAIVNSTNQLLETLGGKTTTSVHRHVSSQTNPQPSTRTPAR